MSPAEPLRILHLCARPYDDPARRIIEVAARLRQEAHEVELLAAGDPTVAEAAGRRGIPVRRGVLAGERRPWAWPGEVRRLRERFIAFKPDIVHAHEGLAHGLAALAAGGLRKRPKIVRTRHEAVILHAGLVNRWLYGRSTDGLVCPSLAAVAQVDRVSRIVGCPVRVVPGGIDRAFHTDPKSGAAAELRRRLGIGQKGKVLTCNAPLEPGRGHATLLRALAALSRDGRGPSLILAYPRRTPERDRLAGLARSLGIEEAVRFYCAPDHLGTLMELTDLMVLPEEDPPGWSRAAVEAMFFRVPVIASEVGCFGELIEQGVNGILVAPHDAEALAEAVRAMLDEPDLLREIGGNGRSTVLRGYTLRHTIDGLVQFYRGVLAGAEPPAHDRLSRRGARSA